ncbi:hypothetical protein ACWKW6_28285 [Dyadobacter jiangsuensis]
MQARFSKINDNRRDFGDVGKKGLKTVPLMHSSLLDLPSSLFVEHPADGIHL